MTQPFSANKREAKLIRLTGTLTIDVNGTAVEVSNTFKIQTDLTYSGMTIGEQETVMNAYKTALKTNAAIEFSTKLTAEEIKSQATSNKTSPIDTILAELNKPDPVDLIAAVVKDDEAKTKSIEGALDILGLSELPVSKAQGVKE